jgi:N-acetyltransferase
MAPSPAMKNQATLLGFFKTTSTPTIKEPESPSTPIRSRASRIAKKQKVNATVKQVALAVANEISHDTSIKKPVIKTPKRMTQLIIDAGQSSLKTIVCPHCSMEYMLGEPTDESLHKKFCKNNKKSGKPTKPYVQYKGYKNERVVRELDDAKIIAIANEDTSVLKKKAAEVRKAIDLDLGITEEDDKIHSTYIYVEDGKITGCIIAQRIDKANKIIVEEGPENRTDLETVNAMMYTSTEDSPAVCGISRMWVHSAHRRKKIAQKLIDTVRETMVYGFHVPLAKLAFSQPTTDGKLFARKYTGTDNFLVYHR